MARGPIVVTLDSIEVKATVGVFKPYKNNGIMLFVTRHNDIFVIKYASSEIPDLLWRGPALTFVFDKLTPYTGRCKYCLKIHIVNFACQYYIANFQLIFHMTLNCRKLLCLNYSAYLNINPTFKITRNGLNNCKINIHSIYAENFTL